MAAPTTVLTVIKRFTYRGNPNEEYSNTYALSGTTPADSGAWRTLFDALVTAEKTVYPPAVSVVRGYGYDSIPSAGDSAIWSVDLTVTPNSPVAGTLVVGTAPVTPGDDAVWVRWGLDRFNSKGKRVYLRKYFHPGMLNSTTGGDALHSTQKNALTAFGDKLRDGTFAGSRVITDRLGTAVVGTGVSAYATTRTLKRRGKRPPT